MHQLFRLLVCFCPSLCLSAELKEDWLCFQRSTNPFGAVGRMARDCSSDLTGEGVRQLAGVWDQSATKDHIRAEGKRVEKSSLSSPSYRERERATTHTYTHIPPPPPPPLHYTQTWANIILHVVVSFSRECFPMLLTLEDSNVRFVGDCMEFARSVPARDKHGEKMSKFWNQMALINQ